MKADVRMCFNPFNGTINMLCGDTMLTCAGYGEQRGKADLDDLARHLGLRPATRRWSPRLKKGRRAFIVKDFNANASLDRPAASAGTVGGLVGSSEVPK